MTPLPERLKELASRMNQDGDKYDAFTLLAEAVQALQAPEVVKETTINHARDPHCCGCYVIRWNDGDPVAVCGECGVQVALLDRIVSGAPEGGEWRTIDSAPEGRAVLLAIEYANGKRRVIRAMRAGERTLHLGDDQDHWDGCLYDEAEDAYYCAPGWYEKNEFDEVNWAVSDKPIAWQPLPAAPSPTAALQAGVGRFVACRCVSERDRELCMTKDECSKVYAYSDTAPRSQPSDPLNHEHRRRPGTHPVTAALAGREAGEAVSA